MLKNCPYKAHSVKKIGILVDTEREELLHIGVPRTAQDKENYYEQS